MTKCPKCGAECIDHSEFDFLAGADHYRCNGKPTGEYYPPVEDINGNVIEVERRTPSCGWFSAEEVISE